eukprot:Gb_14156 [translate_table: standard]
MQNHVEDKEALDAFFEGAENLPGGGGSKYGTSISVDVAMDPARDVILAYMQNGELLHPDHSFPVRIIIPGYMGGRMVKGLKRIVVTSEESDNHVDAKMANTEGWWYQPEYIINDQ